jgi:hypothetical protein
MPGVTLHLVLADRALDAWRRERAAPFDLDDPDVTNAFHHGAVGPDLGYFPGGDRSLSDLAHCLRTGALARTLVRSARTCRERAFAWGWVTHVLADQAIHPWIGRGVGELVHGDRDRFVDGSSDLLSHLRVEMGVDAWYYARHPSVRRRRLRPVFPGPEIDFLVAAYASTYGVAFHPRTFRRSHLAAGRRAGQALATLRLVHALMGDRHGASILPRVGRGLRALYRFGALRNATLAYLTPVLPSPWLLEGVAREMERHTRRFVESVEAEADDLLDWNLDTGQPLSTQRHHPGTERARAAVAARAGRMGSAGESARGRHGTPELPLAEPAPLGSEA